MVENRDQLTEEVNHHMNNVSKSSVSNGISSSQTTSEGRVSQQISIESIIPAEVESPNCPVCLSRIEDRAYTDSCLHAFCRSCIEKWSQNHNRCPLCRQTYTTILHNIRSKTDFDRLPVPSQSSGSDSGLLLVDGDLALLFTPLDSGIYMITSRETPHGMQNNRLFLAPNQSFVLQNVNQNTVFLRPENLDQFWGHLDEMGVVGQSSR